MLGDDLDIEIQAFDETNTVIPIAQISRRIRANNGQGLVCLVGVQSNQFPRAMDIARQFREHGVQVAIGGFHVSGCLSMLPSLPQDLLEAQGIGVSLFAGEAEGRLDSQRRAGMPVVGPLRFYSQRLWEILSTNIPGLWYFLRLTLVRKRIHRDPSVKQYSDIAIAPMVDGDEARLAMFGVTDAAKAAVRKAKRHDSAIASANTKARINNAGQSALDIPVTVASQ